MNEFAVAAALTFAASAHCVGMCGGFAAAASAGARSWRLLASQLLLQLGKATSYMFLGALAGALGGAIVKSAALSMGGRIVTVAAGLALLFAGLALLGLLGRGDDALSRWLAPHWARVMGPLLQQRPAGFPLVVGMAMGFFPCPLVYAGVGAAAATGSPLKGALTMAGVGLGTVPALLLSAAFGSMLSAVWRRNVARIAGVLLVAFAALTIARGFGVPVMRYLHMGGAAPASADAPCH
ncbi:MAG: sulfite exporter TauE/SafE family protein [Acidobacteria bacterium]|nr:sulfite exporter TauE/SafE family protein [Acidobacteriota bacterium]